MSIDKFYKMQISKNFADFLKYDNFTSPNKKGIMFNTVGMGFDTESSTIFDKEIVKFKNLLTGKKEEKEIDVVKDCFCYSYCFSLDEKIYHFRYASEMIEFLQLLSEYANKYLTKKHKIIIWIANMPHEWAFIKNYIHNNFNVTNFFAVEKRKPLLIELNTNIQLRECIGLFGHSLNNISKNWCTKYKKLIGDLDYNLIRTSETRLTKQELQYIYNDVLILSEMHKNIIKHYKNVDGSIVIPYTSTGFLRLALKESLNNDSKITEQRECFNEARKKHFKNNCSFIAFQNQKLYPEKFEDWQLIRKYGFSGGLCGSGIDNLGKILNNVVCMDKVSDYPFQLLYHKYPCGKITKCFGDKPYAKHFIKFMNIDIVSKYNHGCLSKHKILNGAEYGCEKYQRIAGNPEQEIIYNGKYLKGYNLVVIFNEIDLDAYSKVYDIKINKVYSTFTFSEFEKIPEWHEKVIIEDYIAKKVLKDRGLKNSPEYNDSKSRLNANFGCLATNNEEKYEEFDDNYNFSETELSYKEMKNSILNPFIAFYCTSYARREIMQAIASDTKNVTQYDTDSVYAPEKSIKLFDFLKSENIKFKRYFENNYPNQSELWDLGQWDFDGKYHKFLALGAKKYITEDEQGNIKETIAGLPKKSLDKMAKFKNMTINDFNVYEKFVELIDHVFHGKLCSLYNDTNEIKTITINGVEQETTSYHALVPIDFLLSMGIDMIDIVNKIREDENKCMK